MHAWARRALACLALLFVALVAAPAFAAFHPPPDQGPITDTAGKLTPEDVDYLARKLYALREQSGYEVTVFVCGSLEGEAIEDVAYTTFNAWHLGQAKKGNGVLLVIAPNERRVRIETGKGVEGALTDLESEDVLRNHVEPHLRANDFRGAIDDGAQAIARALLRDDPGAPGPRAPGQRGAGGAPEDVSFGKVAFFIFLIIVVIIGLARRGFGGFWWGGGGGFGGGGWGGGGGGGGGGGWGGGGSSGGGGASDGY